VLFLLLSLFIIAASLYLPEHIMLITNRILYYFSGDERTLADTNKAVQNVGTHIMNGAATSFNQRIGGAGALAGNGRGYMEP
jgi:hypothetical protein